MTLIQLKYVISVDTYRHFATAADHCFVTQPTLSMQISKLEKELDVLIFDRNKHPVEPTELGKQIIAQARIVVQEAERIDEMVKGSKGIISGEFRLGIIPTISPSILPRILRTIITEYPDIQLRIEELQTDQILDQINKNQLDAGILATPLENDNFIERPLYYEPFMAYIPEGHRLENEEFVLHSELKLNDILLLKNGHCFRDNVINLCKAAFPETHDNSHILELESGNFETLIKLSNQGFGMTLLPYLTALDLAEENKKYVKPIEHPQPTREISIIHSKAQLKLSIIDIISEVVQKQIPEKLIENKDGEVLSPLRK